MTRRRMSVPATPWYKNPLVLVSAQDWLPWSANGTVGLSNCLARYILILTFLAFFIVPRLITVLVGAVLLVILLVWTVVVTPSAQGSRPLPPPAATNSSFAAARYPTEEELAYEDAWLDVEPAEEQVEEQMQEISHDVHQLPEDIREESQPLGWYRDAPAEERDPAQQFYSRLFEDVDNELERRQFQRTDTHNPLGREREEAYQSLFGIGKNSMATHGKDKWTMLEQRYGAPPPTPLCTQ